MKVAYKRVGEPLVIEETDLLYQSDYANKVLGAVTQGKVYADRYFFLVVDDDGWAHGADDNFLWPYNMEELMPVKGDVAFIRVKEPDPFEEIYDYEIDDLTERDINFLQNYLSEETQCKIRESII